MLGAAALSRGMRAAPLPGVSIMTISRFFNFSIIICIFSC